MINTLFGNLIRLNNVTYKIIRSYKIAIYAQKQAHKLRCKWTKSNDKYLVIKEI